LVVRSRAWPSDPIFKTHTKKKCFRAASLTKSDLEMDVEKLISLVFDNKPL